MEAAMNTQHPGCGFASLIQFRWRPHDEETRSDPRPKPSLLSALASSKLWLRAIALAALRDRDEPPTAGDPPEPPKDGK